MSSDINIWVNDPDEVMISGEQLRWFLNSFSCINVPINPEQIQS